MRIAVAASREWSRRALTEWRTTPADDVLVIADRGALTVEALRTFAAEIVFFMHWSWKISPEIFEQYECVLFHMTDLPYGRGGSPLQNLIQRGHTSTMLSAIRVAEDVDAGAVYMKRPLSLCGTAEEIFMRTSRLILQMMDEILEKRPAPVPQSGEPVLFRRRTAEESRIAAEPSLDRLYDFIRMLDADGYPRAFFTIGKFRFELSRPSRRVGRIVADATITIDGEEGL
jgi:methionyl-tRNA formyltransferase